MISYLVQNLISSSISPLSSCEGVILEHSQDCYFLFLTERPVKHKKMKNRSNFLSLLFVFSLYYLKKNSTLSARSFSSLWVLGNNVSRSVARPERLWAKTQARDTISSSLRRTEWPPNVNETEEGERDSSFLPITRGWVGRRKNNFFSYSDPLIKNSRQNVGVYLEGWKVHGSFKNFLFL